MPGGSDEDATAPESLPDLSSLAITRDDAPVVIAANDEEPTTTQDDATPAEVPQLSGEAEDVNDIWASVPRREGTAEGNSAGAAGGYHPGYTHTPPAPAVDLNDLDPFAPIQGTLGSTVRRESRLELMDNSESDKETNSPTETERLRHEQEERLGHGQPTASGSGFSLGNMLRSLSGTPNKDRPASASTPPPPPLPLPDVGTAEPAKASTSNDPQSSVSSSPAQPGPSGLAKPLASIASVFRASARPSPAGSDRGSPQPGSSPPREKGGLFAAIAGAGANAASAKGKEREREPLEKADELDEKRSEEPLGEKGQRKGRGDEPVFDFNRFLEQMRSRSADPIAKYLRSCVSSLESRLGPTFEADQDYRKQLLERVCAKTAGLDE